MISKLPNNTKVFKTLRMPNIRRGWLNVRGSCCPWEVAAEADPCLQLCGWGGVEQFCPEAVGVCLGFILSYLWVWRVEKQKTCLLWLVI